MHEFMFRYFPSQYSLLHKFTSGYPNDACFGFIFDAKTGTLLLYPVYYEISDRTLDIFHTSEENRVLAYNVYFTHFSVKKSYYYNKLPSAPNRLSLSRHVATGCKEMRLPPLNLSSPPLNLSSPPPKLVLAPP